MSLYDQSLLAYDVDFISRVTACVSNEDRSQPSPEAWAGNHRWHIASAPGFADAYASALASGVEHPGRDEAVISDAQILAAVQAVLTQTPASL